MGASFAINAAIYTLQEGWILSSMLEILKEAMYSIKVSCPESKAAAANSFFSINLTYLVVGKASSMV